MDHVIALSVALVTSASIVWAELSNHPEPSMSYYFLRKCWCFWGFGLVIGIVAMILAIVIPSTPPFWEPFGISIANPWGRGLVAGLLVYLFRLVLRTPGTVTAFGFSFTNLLSNNAVSHIERRQFARIYRAYDSRVREYLSPYIVVYGDIEMIRNVFANSLSPSMPTAERKAALEDIKDDEWLGTPERLLNRYIAVNGVTSFRVAFPLGEKDRK